MGKEAKIGLAVILALLVTFGVVLAKRLNGTGDEPLASTSEAKSSTPSHPDATKNSTATVPVAKKPTVVALKPRLPEPPKPASDGLGQWSSVSDQKTTPDTVAPTTPLPSYMPAPAAGDPSQRYASTLRYPSLPPITQNGSPTPPAPTGNVGTPPVGNAAAYDPFHGRTQQMPDAGTATVGDQGPNPVRPLGPPPTVSQGADPNGYGTGADRYGNPYRGGSPTSNAISPQVPTFQESSRNGYSTQSPPGSSVAQMTVSHSTASTLDQGTRGGKNGEYEVQPNDNYWSISKRLYGSGAYFRALAEHNRNRYPREDQLAVGDVIAAPSVEELEKGYAELCPKPSHRETVRNLARAVSTRVPYGGGRTYVVQKGDTLYDIARYELGKASRWAEIHALNSDLLGKDYDYLVPGTRLVLPGDDAPADAVTERPTTGSIYRR